MKIYDIFKQSKDDIISLKEYENSLIKIVASKKSNTIKNNKEGYYLGKYLEAYGNKVDINNIDEENIKRALLKGKSIADKYLEDILINEDKGIIMYRLKDSNKKIDAQKSEEDIKRVVSVESLFFSSILLNLIILMENCIGKIFRYYIEKYPNAYLSNSTLDYPAIITMNSLDDVKKTIVEKEVSKIMHQGIKDWFKVLSEKHKVKISFEDDSFDRIIEIYYRRNLLVHNDLIVNKEYLQNVKDATSKYKEGQRLRLTEDYINEAFILINKLIVNLIYSIDILENKDNDLIDIMEKYAYQCMLEKEWDTAGYIYEKLMIDERYNQQEKLFARFNYWQCQKRSGKYSNVEEEIKSMDISVCEDVYKLAKYTLLEDNENIVRILERSYKKCEEINATNLMEWPLFTEFRLTEEYRKFKEKHKKDFEERGKEVKEDSNNAEIIDEINESEA